MSSILTETLSSVFESMNPYVNEVVAVALFGVGYFLFRSFSFKKAGLPEKAKLATTATTSLSEVPAPQDLSLSLYQFNVYIRDNLSHKPNVNPFETLHQMQTEGLIPDITSYNTLLDICVEQRNYETCWKLLAQMKDALSPVKPDIITFNTMMKGLSLKIEETFNRKKEEIEIVFQQMEGLKAEIIESGLSLNEITYNTMIDACVKVNRMKKAFDYFDEMQRLNLKPDVYTYSTLIKGIKNPECISPENNLSRVFGILDKLKEIKLVKTDEILYNCVIDACFKFGDYQKAVKLFNDMIAAGVKPSAITYGIMIKGYGQYKNIDGALQIYEKMTLENIPMNEITLGCLIDACVKCNNLSKGMQILEREHDKANTIIYTTVLKGYTKEKNLDKAFEIFQRMKANETSKPNIVTLNSLLDCAVQCFNFEKMDSIYREILRNSSNENSEVADLITYSTYIKGLCRAKRLDEAYELYQKLKRERVFKLDEVLYNSLLDGLVKIRENERALEVYNSMLADDISPSNVTYSIMIKLYGNQGKVDEALSVHRQMKREGIRPGLIVYTCLIQTCVKHKRINLIDDLYSEMCENKIVGDPVFYNTLISGLVYNQNLRKGVEILVGTLEKGIRLNDEVYTNILKNLCKIMERKNNYEAPGSFDREDTEINLLKICQLMKKNKVFIEMSLYNQIASYLYKDLGGQSGSPKEYSNGPSSNFNKRSFNDKQSYSDSKPAYSDSKPRMNYNSHLNAEPAPRKPAFQVNSGVDSGRKPVFFNKNRTVPSNI